ncbi:MAG: glycosyltransferase 87 family protein [Anaerolineales bacterium]
MSRWLALAAGLAICALMVWQWELAIDLHLFLNAARSWMMGRSALYDAGSPGFFYMPWSLALFAPLALLPSPLAVGVWTALTLASIALSAWTFRVGSMRLGLAVINLHTFSLVLLGQFDAVTLLGVSASWLGVQQRKPQLLSIGLWLMTMKPVNAIVPMLLLLWAARSASPTRLTPRGWHWREWVSGLSWPLLSLAASFIIAGVDWPQRYLARMRVDPPSANPISTVWNAAEALRLPWLIVALLCTMLLTALVVQIRRRGVNAETFGLGMATALTVTPYALSAHYVLLVPALMQLRSRVWLITVYAATWLPLLRGAFGVRAIWVEVLYPIVMLIAMWATVPSLVAQQLRDGGGVRGGGA